MSISQESERIISAANYAAQIHVGQRRKGVAAEPYLNHLLEVAVLVADSGADADVVIAALLHDSVEDAGITENQLAEMWGPRVAGLVMEVTDDKSLPKEERKCLQVANAPKKSPDAATITMADKISNLRSIASSPPADWSMQRQKEYYDWADKVVGNLSSRNPQLLDQFTKLVDAFYAGQK